MRRRRLTTDELWLWVGATRSVRPLHKSAAQLREQAAAAGGPAGEVVEPPPLAREASRPPLAREASRPPRAAAVAPPVLAPLPRRDKVQLKRGRAALDARLDLHGLTQAQAHAALLRFVQQAQAQGARFVLVITGTGMRSSQSERGVLRRQVPLWFELPEFRRYVLGFTAAHTGHGGEGALYVRIRRNR